MPSRSFMNFRNYLLVDVDRIIKTHEIINHDGSGRRGLGHITRSGVLMLCAAWEVYMEEVLVEGIGYVIQKASTPDELPKQVRKELSKAVKNTSNQLEPLKLAGEGWKDYYLFLAKSILQGFHTPKPEKLDHLFKQLLGIESVSEWWTMENSDLNEFIAVRGEIAHRGRAASYVKLANLKWYKEWIYQTALEVDNELTVYLRDITSGSDRPWKRRYE